MKRGPRIARWVRTAADGLRLIQFRPGGYYWLAEDDTLLTGIHRRVASQLMHAKLLDHAKRATKDWTL